MDWNTPDGNLFRSGSFSRSGLGSDSALVNICLLRNKYNTEVAIQDGVLFRYYNGKTPNRKGYGFPLSSASPDLRRCVKLLALDADRRNIPFTFCLCDERQAAAINSVTRASWASASGDSDYIYKRERLASLAGRRLQKKRNHIHRFRNTYPDWRYDETEDDNSQIAFQIAAQWLAERKAPEDAERLELDAIKLALDSREAMRLFGGILYAGDEPAAMTLASAISADCVDVHFEKAVGVYAQNGAFAAVNQCFAASPAVSGYEYINREEDMGAEGLRRAKESYDPVYKVQKYYGEILSC